MGSKLDGSKPAYRNQVLKSTGGKLKARK
ncbi:uncharacterized protein G2W53_036783 [Senna tora]|uniref:Uncharacterized protein n=1 Tax=Senna tora TaxID=362788 RepID=A0A834STH6_9FABA|nr:uncharacterized protein G2W53_036783 [Senna tora]